MNGCFIGTYSNVLAGPHKQSAMTQMAETHWGKIATSFLFATMSILNFTLKLCVIILYKGYTLLNIDTFPNFRAGRCGGFGWGYKYCLLKFEPGYYIEQNK